MPSDRSQEYLLHILTEIELAEQFVGSLTEEQFSRDDMRLHAVVRCLEIISEASRRLPPELKARHPDVPWQNIAGSGNIYRHDYEQVQGWRVWETVKSMAPLRAAIEHELAK